MSEHFHRASILFQQSRFELAEEELRKELSGQPENSALHAMLALCLAKQEKYHLAMREARAAVHHGPDSSYAHHVMASVLHDQNQLDEAVQSIREAIRNDPDDPDNYSLQAVILAEQNQWQEAVTAAEQGLQLDPQHAGCTNTRAMALVRLGRKGEADEAIETALATDPNDPVTHANQGLALLHRGKAQKAMEHFRESLRLDPTSDYARDGMIEALKSRNWLYRIVLRYFLWMSRFSTGMQWTISIGFIAVYFVLRSLERSHPSWGLWLEVVLLPLGAFFMLTVIAHPLFNLIMRFDPIGRFALTSTQIRGANWIAVTFVVIIGFFDCWAATGNLMMRAEAIYLIILLRPIYSTFEAEEPWPHRGMVAFVILMLVILGAYSAIRYGVDPSRGLLRFLQGKLMLAYLLGCIFPDEIAEWMKQREPFLPT